MDHPTNVPAYSHRPGNRRVLLARRHRYTGQLSFYRCWTHGPVPLSRLIAIAVARWRIEMVFTQLAKRAVRPGGGGWEHVADLDLSVGDDHVAAVELRPSHPPPRQSRSVGELERQVVQGARGWLGACRELGRAAARREAGGSRAGTLPRFRCESVRCR